MKFMFSESNYKLLKWVATIFLPALATFWLAFAEMWGIPNTMAVVGTITITDTLLGTLIQISSHNFNKQLTTVTTVATDTVQEVEDVVSDVVEGIVGEKNIPYDAEAPPSHRKED